MPSAQCKTHKNSVLISVWLLKRPPERKALKNIGESPLKSFPVWAGAGIGAGAKPNASGSANILSEPIRKGLGILEIF